MKKRSIAARLGVAAMALTLITTSLSSGTLAKYTNTYKATTTLKVAGWSPLAQISYGDKTDDKIKSMTKAGLTFVDLATTANATKADSVVPNYVAPGMNGQFFIDAYGAYVGSAAAAPDVAMDYTIYINASNPNRLPKNFTMYPDSDKGSALTWDTNADNFKNATLGWILATGSFNAGQSAAQKSVTVNWEWPYEPEGGGTDNDEDDTKIGEQNKGHIDDTLNVGFTITVEFTQSNPTATPNP